MIAVVGMIIVGIVLLSLLTGSESSDRPSADEIGRYRNELTRSMEKVANALDSYLISDAARPGYRGSLEELDVDLPDDVELEIAEVDTALIDFCIEATHTRIPRDHPWHAATWEADDFYATEDDFC